jgi:hypothetical protein
MQSKRRELPAWILRDPAARPRHSGGIPELKHGRLFQVYSHQNHVNYGGSKTESVWNNTLRVLPSKLGIEACDPIRLPAFFGKRVMRNCLNSFKNGDSHLSEV